MTTQNYLIVNKATNTVENICLWDGNLQTWQPPANTLMLVEAITPAMLWEPVIVDSKVVDYVLTEFLGAADIGFTWNGTAVITNQPKPAVPTTS